MKFRRPNSRNVLTTIGVAVTVAAAAVLWQHLPTPTDVLGPFDVHGSAGTPTTGRAVSATVTSVRVTPEVDSVKPAGTWVVVDTAIEGIRSTEMPHSELIVGPNTYTPSDIFFTDTLTAEISPGITQRGSWVFDVAPDLVAPGSSAPLTLRVWVGDGRLDSRLAIRIPTNGSQFTVPSCPAPSCPWARAATSTAAPGRSTRYSTSTVAQGISVRSCPPTRC